MRLIRIFVSSPGDVAEERSQLRDAVDRINATEGKEKGVRFELVRWEHDVAPQIDPPPRDGVDARLPGSDIVLGIMAARFGAPIGEEGSGTEQELRDAVAQWGEKGAPWIRFYFREKVELSGDPEEAQQYADVCKFRQDLASLGISASYTAARGEATGLFEQVDQHLRNLLNEHLAVETREQRPLRPIPTDKPAVPPAYGDWLCARCADVNLLGLALKREQAVGLDQVYVPLTTSAGREGRDPRESGERDEARARRPDPETPRRLLDLLDRHSLYVTGPSGSGKSTFCRRVAWLTCTGDLPLPAVRPPEGVAETFPESFRERLPLLVPLRELWSHLPIKAGQEKLGRAQLEEALRGWLSEKRMPGLIGSSLQAHLKRGSALLILDGVNEVPLSRGTGDDRWSPRKMLLSGLVDAIPPWTGVGNRLLITSRPRGVDEADRARLGLVEARISELDEPLQSLLLRRWFHLLAGTPAEGEEITRTLREALAVREELKPLVTNPMLLTAICLIHHESARLPDHRHDLYERIVHNALSSRITGDPAEIDAVRNRLSVIAYGMHTGEGIGEDRSTPEVEATHEEIERMIRAHGDRSDGTEPDGPGAVEAREALLSQTGLLLPRGDRHAVFSHLSVQEFLAGLRLLEVKENDLFAVVCTRAAVEEWHPTLAFVFGALLGRDTSPEGGFRLINRLIDTDAPEVLGLQLVIADCLEVLLRRGIHLPPEVAEKYRRHCLSAIAREVPVRERFRLGMALGDIGDPRIMTDLRDSRAYIEIPAGLYVVGDEKQPFELEEPFRISRYPVTNDQFKLFIEDGGYENSEWWSDDGRDWRGEAEVREPRFWRNLKWNGPNQPVVGVSYWEAEAFARWAGGELPTEHEWEIAARGPEGFKYAWGNAWEDGICNSDEAGLGVTSPVGLFPRARSRPFALEDMTGNVWEWTSSLHEKHESFRVLRGGSWVIPAGGCRTTFRDRNRPGYRGDHVGFRLRS